jgi:hypothetical protein
MAHAAHGVITKAQHLGLALRVSTTRESARFPDEAALSPLNI